MICSDVCPDTLRRQVRPAETNQHIDLPSRCIWISHRTNWTWSSFSPLFLSDTVCRGKVAVSSKDWCWTCSAVTLKYFCYFILPVLVLVLSRSVANFKPLSLLLFLSFPQLRGVCVCVWLGRFGRLTEELLRWASTVFSLGGSCQQRRMLPFWVGKL